MASLTVNSYIDIGTGGVHNMSSWQFAKDEEFTQIIDQSMEDEINIKKWHSKLPKREEDKSDPDAEEYYTELDVLWGRVKIRVGETWSDWYVIGPKNQRNQRVMVTDRAVENEEDPEGPLLRNDYMSNSTALGWTETVFDQDDPELLGPIIKTPEEEEEPEEESEESTTPPTESEQQEGDGMAGDPLPPGVDQIVPDTGESDDSEIIEDTPPTSSTEEETDRTDTRPSSGEPAVEENPGVQETQPGDAGESSGSSDVGSDTLPQDGRSE